MTIDVSAYALRCGMGDEGDALYDVIAAAKDGTPCELCFRGVVELTPTFLNHSIGRLIGELGIERFRELVKPIHIKPRHRMTWDLVCDNAVEYFAAQRAT